MSQVLKTIVVNSSLGFKMAQRQERLDYPQIFKYLDTYIYSLNNVQSHGFFSFLTDEGHAKGRKDDQI